MAATVYEVDAVQGLTLPADRELVIKLGHSPRWAKKHHSTGGKERAMLIESGDTRQLQAQIDEIWKDPAMQARESEWERGTIPVVPIIKSVATDGGTIIFKPKVKGLTLKDIYARHGLDVPPEMKQSLENVFEFGKIVRRRAKQEVGTGVGKKIIPYSPDMKPENFMWIEDPAEFPKFGLKKPGFIWVEFGTFSFGWEKQYGGPFPTYFERFRAFLKINGLE